mmetsp:Transcript_53658/g.61504  ORF Transcript_53658/g.61504 Transcript_53658/m.61504 type:complete len:429 (+) Transcript_53658:264-1550(+)
MLEEKLLEIVAPWLKFAIHMLSEVNFIYFIFTCWQTGQTEAFWTGLYFLSIILLAAVLMWYGFLLESPKYDITHLILNPIFLYFGLGCPILMAFHKDKLQKLGESSESLINTLVATSIVEMVENILTCFVLSLSSASQWQIIVSVCFLLLEGLLTYHFLLKGYLKQFQLHKSKATIFFVRVFSLALILLLQPDSGRLFFEILFFWVLLSAIPLSAESGEGPQDIGSFFGFMLGYGVKGLESKPEEKKEDNASTWKCLNFTILVGYIYEYFLLLEEKNLSLDLVVTIIFIALLLAVMTLFSESSLGAVCEILLLWIPPVLPVFTCLPFESGPLYILCGRLCLAFLYGIIAKERSSTDLDFPFVFFGTSVKDDIDKRFLDVISGIRACALLGVSCAFLPPLPYPVLLLASLVFEIYLFIKMCDSGPYERI